MCRSRAGTLSLRALTSLTQPALLSVAIWSRVFDVSRPPSPTLNRGGKLPSRVLDSPRRRRKVEPVDARRGGRWESLSRPA